MYKNERKRTFLIITLVIVAIFFCFNTLPLIQGVIYSFTNYRGYGTFDWVGLRNYIDLFRDSRVGHSYLFTFKYAIVCTIITNVISLILALGLNSKIRGKSALRGIYFIQYKAGMAWYRSSRRMAGHRHEYDHLHFRPADSSGRCIRSGSPGRSYRMAEIQTPDLPSDHSVLLH